MPLQSSMRAQQHAARVSFFIPGLAIAAWAPLVPFAKERAGLDEAGLGLVLLCLGAGALLAMPAAGVFAARQGCRRVLTASALLICATLPLLAWAASPWLLGVLLFVFGVGVGTMDCAINIQAVMVERDSRKPMMSGFHAFYSIGGLAGAVGMTALLSAKLPPLASGLVVAATMLGLLLPATAHWRSERSALKNTAFAWPRGVVLVIGLLCFVTFLAEGTVLDWSAVFLAEVLGMDASRAGLGFVLFSLAMTATRLLGDSVTRRLGQRRIIVLGALCTAAGFLTATVAPSLTLSLLGYVVVGIGSANIVPALFSLAGQQKTMPPSLAIPAITTVGYAGVLAGPALVGFAAHAAGLLAAFAGVAAAMLGVAICARFLRI